MEVSVCSSVAPVLQSGVVLIMVVPLGIAAATAAGAGIVAARKGRQVEGFGHAKGAGRIDFGLGTV